MLDTFYRNEAFWKDADVLFRLQKRRRPRSSVRSVIIRAEMLEGGGGGLISAKANTILHLESHKIIFSC